MAAINTRGGVPKAWSGQTVDATGRLYLTNQRTVSFWIRNKGAMDLLVALRTTADATDTFVSIPTGEVLSGPFEITAFFAKGDGGSATFDAVAALG